jgi:hypothetical protein
MTSALWLAVTAALILIALAGCIRHLVTGPFRHPPDPSVALPPRSGLMLWLEGDGSFVLDGTGRVARWNDLLFGRNRAVMPLFGFRGTPVTRTFATPDGPRQHVGLRCAADAGRCAYAPRDFGPSPPPLNLTGVPYSILAVVVRRPGPRFDNYFLMTSGTGCQVAFGGTGCTANTVLHLGWWWDSTIRHSHYDFDVDSFMLWPAEEPVLVVAQSGPRGGMDVASLGALSIHSGRTSRPDPGPLSGSGFLLIGGTPFFTDGPAAPDWYFSGDIFALLIYNRELTLAERQQASDYLRNNYGPR